MDTRWEYKVIVLNADHEQSSVRLSNHGAGGWELVAVGGRYETEQFAYLKRRIDQPRSDRATEQK